MDPPDAGAISLAFDMIRAMQLPLGLPSPTLHSSCVVNLAISRAFSPVGTVIFAVAPGMVLWDVVVVLKIWLLRTTATRSTDRPTAAVLVPAPIATPAETAVASRTRPPIVA